MTEECSKGYLVKGHGCPLYLLLLVCLLHFQVGDLLNFSSAVFFGVHMLRTEHIARSTNKDKFLALLGYEVSLCL